MFRKQPGGSSNTSRQQLPHWWPTHWKVPILRPILLPRERSSCELFASSTARAAHNIELWRGQFRRPHCAAILDDLCSVWADMHIEVEEDMKMLVLENVLSAISTPSSEDFCNISVRTSAGRELVLTLDGLSDMKRFEQLLRVTTSVSITKIVDRADGHLQPSGPLGGSGGPLGGLGGLTTPKLPFSFEDQFKPWNWLFWLITTSYTMFLRFWVKMGPSGPKKCSFWPK